MRKILFMGIFCALLAGPAYAWQDSFDGGQGGWSHDGDKLDYSMRGHGQPNFRLDEGVSICAIGTHNWDSLWTGTDVVIAANTEYLMTVRVATACAPPTSWGDGVWLTMQDADDGWASIVPDTSFLFPDADKPADPFGIGPYREFSISFDSADCPERVGHTIGVGVRLCDGNGREGWGDIGYFYVDSVSVVPEPMTFGLLGLGGLVLRRRK